MTPRSPWVWTLVAALLTACGGGGGGGTAEPPFQPAPVPISRSILDPYYDQQWPLNPIAHVPGHWIDPNANIHGVDELARYRGQGVRIAIIDDGLDLAHEDLQGAVVATYNLNTGSSQLAPVVSFGASHGTAVTGVLAARENALGIKGVASQAEIIFIEYHNRMSDSETLEAFDRADALGADIISCSWGTYDVSPSVKEKIQYLARHGRGGKGTPIVFAVGNDMRSMGNDESAIPEVIAVGSTNESNLRAIYSDYGPELDLMAPGGEALGIPTLDAMGNAGVAPAWPAPNYLLAQDDWAFGGTSAAAPIVSGVIAILLEINPRLTRAEIVDILHRSADSIGNLPYVDGRNDNYGHGKVNLAEAVRLARGE